MTPSQPRIRLTRVVAVLFFTIFAIGVGDVRAQITEVTQQPNAVTQQPNAVTQQANNPQQQPQGSSDNSTDSFYLGDICQSDHDCSSTIASSLCKDSGDNSGSSRCACDNKYYAYSKTNRTKQSYKCGRVLTAASNPNCRQCVQNEGTCVEDSSSITGTFCQCPISRTGESCQDVHVNVSCTMNSMRICYMKHSDVNFTDGWRMYTDSHSLDTLCWGSEFNETSNGSFCSLGNQELVLSLNDTDLEYCGTKQIEDSHNRRYLNRIEVNRFDQDGNEDSNVQPYVFNVYCSFTAYKDQTFNGIGIGRVNGNDQGTQVSPTLKFSVKDQFDRLLPPGVTIRVGDRVKFVINMTLDGNYGGLQVLRCTASTSSVMPDSTAETRALTTRGCPIKGEVTANSWYWTQTPIDPARNWIEVYSRPVSMFKLSSSTNVFIHCALKLCLLGDSTCRNRQEADCQDSPDSRMRRAAVEDDAVQQQHLLIHRHKREATDANVQTSLKVEDPNSSAQTGGASGVEPGSPGFVALLVILAIIAVALIVATIVVALRMSRRRAGNSGYQSRPQLFALPRINRTHERF